MENSARIVQLKHFVENFFMTNNFDFIPITSDASARKYYRAICGAKSIVVMDDEKRCCKTPEFVKLSVFLHQHNIFVPQILKQDIDNGILLLEDLGSTSARNALTPENETELYQKFGTIIASIAKITSRPPCVTDFGKKELIEDIRLFSEWYFPMTAGYPLSEEQKTEFLDIVNNLADMAFNVPSRLMLYDYHIDNILLSPSRQEWAIIDFQDAKWGPVTYDLVSLLAADRRTASDNTIAAVKDAFFKQVSGISKQDFDDSFAFLSAYRHLRVLGRFTTLSMVNEKKQYLNYIPQCWEMLEKILQYPKLQPLQQWLDKNVPQNWRKLPTRKPIRSAILLAAGRGTRMQNLTDNMPKPLIKVGKKSLIDYNFERLQNANIKQIVINLCYKGEMIRHHFAEVYPHANITFSEEIEALETGGGVKKALPLLPDSAFFVCNSDVFFIDKGYKPALWRMMDEWNDEKYDILLLLQTVSDICGDKSGDYRLDSNNRPQRNEQKLPDWPYMFSGISIVSRKIFENICAEKFSLRDLFDVAQKNNRLGAIINQADFFHVGTPQALKAAETKISGHK